MVNYVFWLTNSPSTFMRLMNEVFEDILGFFIIYLDNILIFSNIKGEHLENIRQVLQRLKEDKLLINLKKCSFIKEKIMYLGFFILADGLRMDPEKVRYS